MPYGSRTDRLIGGGFLVGRRRRAAVDLSLLAGIKGAAEKPVGETLVFSPATGGLAIFEGSATSDLHLRGYLIDVVDLSWMRSVLLRVQLYSSTDLETWSEITEADSGWFGGHQTHFAKVDPSVVPTSGYLSVALSIEQATRAWKGTFSAVAEAWGNTFRASQGQVATLPKSGVSKLLLAQREKPKG